MPQGATAAAPGSELAPSHPRGRVAMPLRPAGKRGADRERSPPRTGWEVANEPDMVGG
jgi:hypothetical protein